MALLLASSWPSSASAAARTRPQAPLRGAVLPTLTVRPGAPAAFDGALGASALPCAPVVPAVASIAAEAAARPEAKAAAGERLLSRAAAAFKPPGSPAAASPESRRGLAGRIFDHLRPRGSLEPSLPVAAPEPAFRAGALLGSGGSRGEEMPEPGAEVPAPPSRREAREKLPTAFYFFLAGIVLSSIGQAVSTVLLPVLSYSDLGAGLTTVFQAVGLVTLIPGSYAGARWVRRWGSKSVYLWMNAAMAAAFLSLPIASSWLGGVPLAQYLAVAAVNGIAYGSTRGVAEQDITVRIVGQDNEELLRQAGSRYYLVVGPVYIVTPLLVSFLLPRPEAGLTPAVALLSTAASLTMLASLAPFLLTRVPAGAAGAAHAPRPEADGRGESLPLRSYLPYMFFWGAHMGFYYLFSPFFALEIFHSASMAAWFVWLYAAGNFLSSALHTFFPAAVRRLSRRQWTLLGIAATVAFLWISLSGASAGWALAFTFLLGVGTIAGLIQWRSFYQGALRRDAQPGVFRSLSNGAIGATLLPFALLYGAPFAFPGASIPFLLTATSIGVSLAGAWVALSLWRK